jgi:uncharacterized protein YvpB
LVWLIAAVIASAQTGRWIDVPFIRQSPEGCGAASIAMVMQYWDQQQSKRPGDASDPNQILKKLLSREGRGIYASKIQDYLRRQGYKVFAFSGKWEDLEQHVAKGRPLIVGLQPRQRGVLHYVVVVGVDAAAQQVMFNDPAGRKLEKLDRATFEREWKATESWTLLAVPQS